MGPRPIDNKSLAFDAANRDISPESAVVTVVTVIAHHKNITLGDYKSLRLAGIADSFPTPVVIGVFVIVPFSVNDDLLILDLHGITR